MTSEFLKFVLEEQTLLNYLELMNVTFKASDITDDEKKMSIILTHFPTNYLDDNMLLIAPRKSSSLTLAELNDTLKQLFKPKKTILKCLSLFQDRIRLKTETYNIFF